MVEGYLAKTSVEPFYCICGDPLSDSYHLELINDLMTDLTDLLSGQYATSTVQSLVKL